MLRMRRFIFGVGTSCVLACAVSGAQADDPFNQMVSFGGSYIDNGQAPDLELGGDTGYRFTNIDAATGLRGRAFSEHLAQRLGIGSLTPSTPLILFPRTDWVETQNLNFAYGAYRSQEILDSIIADSVVTAGPFTATQPGFLDRVDQGSLRVGPRTLYLVNAGGNDMRDLADPSATADTVAQALQALVDAGAKTIVFPNLPRLGQLSESTNLTPGGRSALSFQRTAAALAFNEQMRQRLNAMRGNFVRVDLLGLLDEVLADPVGYGYSPLVDQMRECYSDTEAGGITCDEPAGLGKDSGGNPDDFVFLDGLHLTQPGALIFADIIAATLRGPGEVALLPEAALSSARDYGNALDDFLKQQRWLESREGVQGFFALQGSDVDFDARSSTPEATANSYGPILGAGWGVGDWLVGGSLGGNWHELEIDGSGSEFEGKSLYLSVFGAYRKNSWFTELTGTFGKTWFEDLDRRVALGEFVVRQETGDTTGDTFGARLAAGTDLIRENRSVRFGPLMALDYWNIDIDDYSEAGQRSTAMWFGGLERESLVGSIGAFMSAPTKHGFGSLEWTVDLAYAKEFRDDSEDVRAVVKNLANGPSFAMPGYEIDDSAVTGKLGLMANLNNGLSLGLSYRYVHNAARAQGLNLLLGYSF